MSTDFGVTVSIPKTYHMVVEREIVDSDKDPISIEGGEIEAIGDFPYLRFEDCSTRQNGYGWRIAQASRAFGALRKAVFLDKSLRLKTKRKIYQACVLSVLLYGSECWIPLRKHLKKLNSFHHKCIKSVLDISSKDQWESKITSSEVRKRWGDTESAAEKVTRRRLEWLRHLARMPDYRLPKLTMFGWLPQPRPRCSPRKRWRDVI